MAFNETSGVSIRGISACVPRRIVENKDSDLFTQEELEKQFKTVGIERRHCVVEGQCTSDLCFTAAEKLLDELKWEKQQIEILVFVTQTPDYRNPATACILQDRLGLSVNCMAFDISMGCSGYIYGLSVITSIMSGGHIRKGLLLVGDTTSVTTSPEDKSRILLFGDAGTATALEYSDSGEDMKFHLATDGSGFKAIMTPDSGFRSRVKPSSFEMEDFGGGIRRAKVHSLLDGLEVFSFGISRAPETVNQLVNHFSINMESVDYFLFHQANLMMNEKIRKKLKLPEEKVPYNLKDYGNTSCASIPLLMVTNLREKITTKETELVLCAFGVGLSWATCFLNMGIIKCPELQYL